jgi:hypothetical protein
LLKARRLDGCVLDSEGAGNLSSTTAIDNSVIPDKVADNAESIVE